jgi:hypothetical protein
VERARRTGIMLMLAQALKLKALKLSAGNVVRRDMSSPVAGIRQRKMARKRNHLKSQNWMIRGQKPM